MSQLLSLNLSLFAAIHGLTGHSALLDWIAVFLADYLQYVLALIFVILIFYPKDREVLDREMVVLASFSALVSRFIIKPLILLVCAEPRPFVSLHFIPLIGTLASENFQSFPSGHALFFFALATSVYLFDKKWGIFFFVAATLMGIARIYVGVHWPLDILSGALIGMLIGWFTFLFYMRNKEISDRWIDIVFEKLPKLS